MNNASFNYKSDRSEKARIAVKFSKSTVILLNFFSIINVIIGLVLLLIDIYAGWIMIGFSFIPAMIVEWYKGELINLKPAKIVQNIDDCLSFEILGQLSKEPSPKEMASIIGIIPGGHFISTRFGISSNFISSLASENKDDSKNIWQEAWNIKNITNSKEITAVILFVALVKNIPNYRALIAKLQLDEEDLIRGVEWYDHLINLINSQKKYKKVGGIARDWSFGWTPLLNQYAINISEQSINSDLLTTKIEAHNESIDKLIEIFSKKGKQNAALVGQVGVGKTQIVKAFAYKIMNDAKNIPNNLRYRQVFMLDASSIIASATNRGQIESLVPSILVEAYNAKNIIICLDNAELFFKDGIGAIDISNVLLPILEAGNLRVILTMDEQEFLRTTNNNPKLANTINRIQIYPANKEQTIAILQDQSVSIEFQKSVTFMYQALSEAYRLGDRYVYDLAMPGKAIKIFEAAANYSENGLVTSRSVQLAIENSMDIKIGIASDSEEKEKLLHLEELIHKRMINQNKAVTVISDALRRSRSGVRNQNRPIGTFLFLGPTGVGKTELAKALADVYFGNENNIIRIDMNEFSLKNDVEKLIADGANNSNSLTAKIMKHPFSVVLLDEIEKAHPNALLLLLQALDEGIIRDEKNREISLRDAIIIATSNAASDYIVECVNRGYDLDAIQDKIINVLIENNQFRPEFINRFDEIVLFRSLGKEELLKVVNLMIDDVNKTLNQQKISVTVPEAVKKYLVEVGYDPKFGARPMRRIVQKTIENVIAKDIISGNTSMGEKIEISLEQVKNALGK